MLPTRAALRPEPGNGPTWISLGNVGLAARSILSALGALDLAARTPWNGFLSLLLRRIVLNGPERVSKKAQNGPSRTISQRTCRTDHSACGQHSKSAPTAPKQPHPGRSQRTPGVHSINQPPSLFSDALGNAFACLSLAAHSLPVDDALKTDQVIAVHNRQECPLPLINSPSQTKHDRRYAGHSQPG